MTLPSAPASYNLRDQDTIRHILELGLDETLKRLLALESAPSTAQLFPFHFGLWSAMPTPSTFSANVESFKAFINADDKNTIIPRINAARAAGRRIVLFPHASHVWSTAGGKFDMPTWTARLVDTWTPANVAAAKAGLIDGTVIAHMTVEEPHGPDYGGVITRATLDSCAAQIKNILGQDMPVGCNTISYFRPEDGPYKVLDFTQSQFVYSPSSPFNMDPVAWRNGRLADSAASGVKWVAGINPVNGGAGFNIPAGGCANPPTLGPGFDTGRCAMGTAHVAPYTLGQLRDSTIAVLGTDPSGHSAAGLWFWKWWDPYFSNGNVKADNAAIATLVASQPPRSLLRTAP